MSPYRIVTIYRLIICYCIVTYFKYFGLFVLLDVLAFALFNNLSRDLPIKLNKEII